MNAVGTVTCWSSANPISSAMGSVASSRSASSFPVKWSASGTARMLVDDLLPARELAALALRADGIAPVRMGVEEGLQQLPRAFRLARLGRLPRGEPVLVVVAQVVLRDLAR